MKSTVSKLLSVLLILCLFFQLPVNVLAAEGEEGPKIKVTYTVKNQLTTFHVSVSGPNKITKVSYLWGNLYDPYSSTWEDAENIITGKDTVTNENQGQFSFRVVDEKGRASSIVVNVVSEFQAVWISYLEFKSSGYTKKEFTSHINQMFDSVANMGMNAVVVQVRPFGDAMYQSKFFPWSKYVSGEQGKDPGFDPLEIMVDAAHKRNLEFHAWINPYRITTGSTDINTLAKTNPARKWRTDSDASNDRNVLAFGNNLYYNPASYQVRSLIRNGVNEIVTHYDVDGIHFDDYFYPTLGKNYETEFDAPEYQTYVATCKKAGINSFLSIADWRRRNVNYLVRGVYSLVNARENDVIFGISPSGNLDSLLLDDRHYCDVKTWMSRYGYVDYICPQIYWSFEHATNPFDKTVDSWMAIKRNHNVSLYIGIPVYKAGSKVEDQFYKDPNILADMIDYCRAQEGIDGYLYFRYQFFHAPAAKKAVTQLITTISK